MPETTVLKVLLHCDGCVSKVKRHIRRLEGVESFHVDQKNSKVTVYGTVKPQAVLDKVLHAGKTAEFWPHPAEEVTKVEVPDTPKEASAQEAAQDVGKKKKASDNAGGKATKKLKSGKKVKHEEEIELEVVGDGEIVDLPVLQGDEESDERVLIKNKKPRKKGIFSRG